ncbi:3'-5' exonuclease [Candidatus Woesearchaeota archaeon]|jgi:DNA polymerase III subunit alpha, Gram-positive type|nr:3'-5' exonuclease [Candidatus Woesearchaeota archaeon]
MVMGEYVVLDLETTGLSKKRHRITEIAAVRVKKNKVVDEFQCLVNPEQRIPSFITRLTGITNDMVKTAEPINKVLPEFIEFLGNSPIIAHNASFDYGFIEHNAKKHLDVCIENPRLCTRKLANRLLPELPSKRLGCICEHFEIINQQAHRAMSDVLATTEVFYKFLDMVKDEGIKSEAELVKFEKSPRRRK